jgi:hypothetical protein
MLCKTRRGTSGEWRVFSEFEEQEKDGGKVWNLLKH